MSSARLWSREGLSRRDRSLVTMGILIALRATDEFESHVRIGLRNGLTEDEIAEVIYHSSGYAGFPNANTAMKVAKQVIEGPGLAVAALRTPTPTRAKKMEPPRGIEPLTYSLRVNCSTD